MLASVAAQGVDELGGRFSVLVRQKRDHVKLDTFLRRLTTTRGREQDRVLLSMYRLVFPHAFAEESVLWPVMRRTLADGHELTLQVEQEHQEVNDLVTELEGLPRHGERRDAIIDRLVDVLREDVRDEEDELFPRLQQATGRRELIVLGVLWEIVRRTAPTRAHPVVSRRPPGNAVAALPLSVIDRVRDVVDYTALRVPGRIATPLEAAGAGLARAAHAIEHLPLLRRGEDSSTRVATA